MAIRPRFCLYDRLFAIKCRVNAALDKESGIYDYLDDDEIEAQAPGTRLKVDQLEALLDRVCDKIEAIDEADIEAERAKHLNHIW